MEAYRLGKKFAEVPLATPQRRRCDQPRMILSLTSRRSTTASVHIHNRLAVDPFTDRQPPKHHKHATIRPTQLRGAALHVSALFAPSFSTGAAPCVHEGGSSADVSRDRRTERRIETHSLISHRIIILSAVLLEQFLAYPVRSSSTRVPCVVSISSISWTHPVTVFSLSELGDLGICVA